LGDWRRYTGEKLGRWGTGESILERSKARREVEQGLTAFDGILNFVIKSGIFGEILRLNTI
jgi:hypothetical protein